MGRNTVEGQVRPCEASDASTRGILEARLKSAMPLPATKTDNSTLFPRVDTDTAAASYGTAHTYLMGFVPSNANQ